ncbi:hypothetical protein BDN71DRAFT_805436 [Pleurotus eryngii]|uniref:Uncharacterized protein n=1 Tax=Pleurotus eryngii TaxID=5323 RepID=A0A9P5ZXP0_PLEER|nr:hypothetical protein BDN71DRAFT_805436 [Pleurotus eryngii]
MDRSSPPLRQWTHSFLPSKFKRPAASTRNRVVDPPYNRHTHSQRRIIMGQRSSERKRSSPCAEASITLPGQNLRSSSSKQHVRLREKATKSDEPAGTRTRLFRAFLLLPPLFGPPNIQTSKHPRPGPCALCVLPSTPHPAFSSIDSHTYSIFRRAELGGPEILPYVSRMPVVDS